MYLPPIILLLAGIANSTPVELSKRIKNGVGLTPAMGFNNWNSGLREFNRCPPRFYSVTKLLQHPQPLQL